MKQFFEDDDFRADALFAYALCARGETSRGRMPGMLRKIDEAAGGLSEVEEEMVKIALDERLALHGKEPFFTAEPDTAAFLLDYFVRGQSPPSFLLFAASDSTLALLTLIALMRDGRVHERVRNR